MPSQPAASNDDLNALKETVAKHTQQIANLENSIFIINQDNKEQELNNLAGRVEKLEEVSEMLNNEINLNKQDP